MNKRKWTIEAAQVIVGCVFAFFGHPYIGVLIAAIHF